MTHYGSVIKHVITHTTRHCTNVPNMNHSHSSMQLRTLFDGIEGWDIEHLYVLCASTTCNRNQVHGRLHSFISIQQFRWRHSKRELLVKDLHAWCRCQPHPILGMNISCWTYLGYITHCTWKRMRLVLNMCCWTLLSASGYGAWCMPIRYNSGD